MQLLADLEKLLALLKAKGVHRANVVMPGTLGTIDVTFAPTAQPLPKEDTSPAEDAESCRCGCPLFIHVNGLCGRGCEVEKCAPPERE